MRPGCHVKDPGPERSVSAPSFSIRLNLKLGILLSGSSHRDPSPGEVVSQVELARQGVLCDLLKRADAARFKADWPSA